MIYITNTVEPLKSVIRKATRQCKVFPSDHSAVKVVYLAMQVAAKKWAIPIHKWKLALNYFMIKFSNRFTDYQ